MLTDMFALLLKCKFYTNACLFVPVRNMKAGRQNNSYTIKYRYNRNACKQHIACYLNFSQENQDIAFVELILLERFAVMRDS